MFDKLLTGASGRIQALIDRLPSQYLWGYHRFKRPRQPEAAA